MIDRYVIALLEEDHIIGLAYELVQIKEVELTGLTYKMFKKNNLKIFLREKIQIFRGKEFELHVGLVDIFVGKELLGCFSEGNSEEERNKLLLNR